MSRHRHALLGLLPLLMPLDGIAWNVKPSGNFHYDWARFDSDRAVLTDDSDIRRARVGLGLGTSGGTEWRVEHDLKANTWTDLFVRRPLGGGHGLRVGQFKQPLFLEELTSDRVTLFMEQGLPSAFALARRTGLEYAYAGANGSAAVTVFGQNLTGDNPGRGYAGRLTWIPWRDGPRLLHLGVAAATEDPDAGSGRFSARPEAALATRRLVDTGTLGDVERIDRAGLEALWLDGSRFVQAEWITGRFRRADGDFAGHGWYVNLGWLPTGHARGYRAGALDGPALERPNALELGLRLSQLDLDDGPVQGGVARNWTLGATWYPTANLRFMANLVRVDSERRGLPDDPRIVEFRAQLSF